MSTKDVFKKYVWEVMVKPIPKLIALYEASVVAATGLAIGIIAVGEMIKQKKK